MLLIPDHTGEEGARRKAITPPACHYPCQKRSCSEPYYEKRSASAFEEVKPKVVQDMVFVLCF